MSAHAKLLVKVRGIDIYFVKARRAWYISEDTCMYISVPRACSGVFISSPMSTDAMLFFLRSVVYFFRLPCRYPGGFPFQIENNCFVDVIPNFSFVGIIFEPIILACKGFLSLYREENLQRILPFYASATSIKSSVFFYGGIQWNVPADVTLYKEIGKLRGERKNFPCRQITRIAPL